MFEKVPELDVREDIRRGDDPFARITAAAAALPVGGRLRLVAPLKPEPMIRLLSSRGYQCAAQEIGGGDWAVLVERISADDPCLPAARPDHPAQPKTAADGVREVDARGLEPPEPMMRVLEAVETLLPGQRLDARTDRRPVYLHAQLEQRGFRAESQELEDGTVLTRIWRRDG